MTWKTAAMIKNSIRTAIVFLVTVLMFASCSAEKEADNTEKYGTEKEVIKTGENDYTDQRPVNDRNSSGFEALRSGRYASAMKEEHFVLSYYIPKHEIRQTICVDEGNVFSEFSDPGVSYKIIYIQQENKQYMIVDDCYCETEVNDTPENILKIYSDLEYISSGTQDIDGLTYEYDEFRQKRLGSSIRLLTDSEGNLKAFDQTGTVAEIESFSNQADKSLFTISDNLRKVSEDEIRMAIEKKIASQNR